MGRRRFALLAAVSLAVMVGVPGQASAQSRGGGERSSWIVVFGAGRATPGPSGALAQARSRRVARAADRAIDTLAIRPTQRFQFALEGFAANLTRTQVAVLRRLPGVRAVVPDREFRIEQAGFERLNPRRVRAAAAPASRQVIPSGVRRVNAHRSPIADIDGRDDARVNVDVAVLDTGIDPHPDLNVAGGYDCMSPFRNAWRDRYGHGTHVAGTIGAIDDRRGVVGVAPGVRLWAVKALDDHGRGFASWYLCGVDWIMSQRDPANPARPLIEVVNMSVSARLPGGDDGACGTLTGDVLHQAICASVADGTTYVAAAGNQSENVAGRLPAAYDEVITVSALADYDGRPGGQGRQGSVCPGFSSDADDTYANFSNYGSDVDIIAPGKCILSSYPRGRWVRFSGTSMATPAVAGAVALYLARYPNARPGQVRDALVRAGSSRWRTSTDPDGRPDPLLDVLGFEAPPTFRIRPASNAGLLGPGGRLELPMRVVHVRGHKGSVTLRAVEAPAGVAATIRNDPGGQQVLVLRADDTLSPRSARVLVRGTDGELNRTQEVPVRLVGGRRVAFTSPAEGALPIVRRSDQIGLAWTESGQGPEPQARRLQRQRATPLQAGSCSGVPWRDDGPAIPPTDLDPNGPPWAFSEQPGADGCYRWLLSLIDGDGNARTWSSGSVIVDGARPRTPLVSARGVGVGQDRPGAVVWVRPGSGTLELTSTGRDRDGGVARSEFGPLQPKAAGWTHTPRAVNGDPATVALGWGPKAAPASLEVVSVDVLGRASDAVRIALRIDRLDPGRASWRSPRSFYITSGEPDLEWNPGVDRQSGFASRQLIQRQRGPVRRAGSCAGVSFTRDGPARLLSSGHEETNLRSGYCYRWRLTSIDAVGNTGPSRLSGAILFDGARPRGNFRTPDEGSVTSRAARSITIRWSVANPGGAPGLSQRLERERLRARANGTCGGSHWKASGPTRSVRRGRFTDRGLLPGWCYRWRLVLEDGAGNMATVISGVRRILP
jgi:hypothetical protein